MGSSESKTKIVVKQVPVECRDKVDEHFERTKKEVAQQKPIITENVSYLLESNEDSLIMRYSQLKNRNDIITNIETIFAGDNALAFLKEAATNMLKAFNSSDEMKQLTRWNQVKKVVKCGDKVVGMELHYKVVITDEKVGTFGSSTDTFVILGYKLIKHMLTLKPNEVPDNKNVKTLSF